MAIASIVEADGMFIFFCFCYESQLIWKCQEHFYGIFWTKASIRVIENLRVE